MPHVVDDIVRMAIEDNVVDLPNAVNDVILNKLGARLDQKRQEVAASVFNKDAPVEA
jgi:hypothetical protein